MYRGKQRGAEGGREGGLAGRKKEKIELERKVIETKQKQKEFTRGSRSIP